MHARALLLAIDPHAGDPPDPGLVRDVLGLTLREARLASFVGIGLRPGQAAEKLGITEETARTALKRVFAKVGVSRQSELAVPLTKLVLR
jgi:DNA-binding CsgD family transcriptional regulator